jgi:glycosyltransferase involved in cell wall biosynthesis
MAFTKKKICWVAASPLTVKFFLTGHIQNLATKYDLTLIGKFDDIHFLDDLNLPIRIISVGIERNISPLKDLLAFFHLVLIFYREKFDLVHSFTPKSGLLAIVAAYLASVPIRIHHFQGEVWATKKFLFRFLLKNLDVLLALCATHLLVVSTSEREFLQQENVTSGKRLEILAHGSICGVDTQKFTPNLSFSHVIRSRFNISPEAQVILFTGRLTYDKGLIDLVEAFASLEARFPNLHLLIVGPDENGLSAIIQKNFAHLKHRIHFNGYTANPEQFIAASDIFCLPSYREGFGLVLMEAAAMQVPTIGSRIYGICDAVIDGETGLLFKPRDVSDLAVKITFLLDNKDFAKQLGLKGRERALKYFKKEVVIDAMEQYYENILQKKKINN